MNSRRRLLCLLALLPAALALTSCGGGGESTVASVATLSAANAGFGRTSTITVNGRRLRDGTRMAVEGDCRNLAKVGTGSDETQQYTCEVRAVGTLRFYVIDAAGAFIAQLSVEVPQPQISFTTPMGSFVVELDAARAPETAFNFTEYVRTGFFVSNIFHRAIPGRGVLTGGYTSGLQAKAPTRGAFALESGNGLKNLRGSVAMFRDEGVDSARSQWYVNVADNPDLDFVDADRPGYAVFGTITSGMEVIDAISVVPTRGDEATGLAEVPSTEVIITSVLRLK